MKLEKGFSIIIPCYNSGKYIIETVDSIIKQNFKYPFEIIVIDDGSDDHETKKSLEKISDYKNLKLLNLNENKGAQVARNTGIKKSQFDYLFCLDADDKLNLDKNILKNGTYPDIAIDVLDKDNDVVFVYGSTLMFEGLNGLTISAYPIDEKMILKKHHVQNSIVYRKIDAIKVGLYDEEIQKWQDWSFAVSLLNSRLKSGKKNDVYYIDRPYYLYRIHDNPNRISSKEVGEEEMIKITFDKNPEIFKKYYKGVPDNLIPKKVLENKPDKLTDLFYVASYNLDRVLKMSKERGLRVISENEPPNIP